MTYGNAHWTLGGTGITNFGIEQLAHYKKAIEVYNDKNLYIELNAMDQLVKPGIVVNMYSLHCKIKECPLPTFWKVFEALRGEYRGA